MRVVRLPPCQDLWVPDATAQCGNLSMSFEACVTRELAQFLTLCGTWLSFTLVRMDGLGCTFLGISPRETNVREW